MSTKKVTDASDSWLLEPVAEDMDYLILGYHSETPPRDVDLHFRIDRVISVAQARSRLEGHRGAHIYYTDNAMRVGTTDEWAYIEFIARWAGGELLHANHFDTTTGEPK